MVYTFFYYKTNLSVFKVIIFLPDIYLKFILTCATIQYLL